MAAYDEILNDDVKLTEMTTGVFTSFDKNGSGQIEKSELQAVMKELFSEAQLPPPTEAQISEELIKLDADQSGTISVEEFKGLIIQVLNALKNVAVE
jgi:Ca2+-binding EF-hand superfamily protein